MLLRRQNKDKGVCHMPYITVECGKNIGIGGKTIDKVKEAYKKK